jgi:hypothetical protein
VRLGFLAMRGSIPAWLQLLEFYFSCALGFIGCGFFLAMGYPSFVSEVSYQREH